MRFRATTTGMMGVVTAALLTGCAPTSRPDADGATLLSRGWEALRLDDFKLARHTFEQALAQADAGTEEQVRARYSLATYWNLRRPEPNRPLAARMFKQLIAETPDSPWAGWSALALVRQIELEAIETPPELARLETGYTALMARYPGHPAAAEALLLLQGARLSQPDAATVAAAATALERDLAAHPDSPYAASAWKLLAHACLLQGRGEARVAALIRAEETALALAAGEIDRDPAAAYFAIATAAQFDAGDFDTARRYYRQLIAEYPTEQKAFVAQQQLQRMDAWETQWRAERGRLQAREHTP